jgi:hypothetical protein
MSLDFIWDGVTTLAGGAFDALSLQENYVPK